MVRRADAAPGFNRFGTARNTEQQERCTPSLLLVEQCGRTSLGRLADRISHALYSCSRICRNRNLAGEFAGERFEHHTQPDGWTALLVCSREPRKFYGGLESKDQRWNRAFRRLWRGAGEKDLVLGRRCRWPRLAQRAFR